jgi:hypothetical protein
MEKKNRGALVQEAWQGEKNTLPAGGRRERKKRIKIP